MKNQQVNVFIPVLLMLMLGACTAPAVKNETTSEQISLEQIKAQANDAYINDDFAQGEQLYLILLEHVPEEPEYWYRLGNIYVMTDRPYAAMNLYQEAIERDTAFAKAWYNLGLVQLKQSAFSFNEMLEKVNNNDPLYSKASEMLEKITAIIAAD